MTPDEVLAAWDNPRLQRRISHADGLAEALREALRQRDEVAKAAKRLAAKVCATTAIEVRQKTPVLPDLYQCAIDVEVLLNRLQRSEGK